eukprot:NODE_3260_length_920_cov_44.786885_g3239_i0.p1 GENE.NODE_3260_length_920_cov_44.786885_g3239_i0~~NODE_3260_length_920_cov_44.786885_g3239_i0.p1  ORF type:complete len:262 (-),score=51.26 NODE_3260_length_920_cov_44.786885_g3239_i0:66-851(-)
MDPTFRDVTRANQFQKKFTLPPDFNNVVKELTREILRDQPADINAYAANYFKKLVLESEGGAALEAPAPQEQDAAETLQQLEVQLEDAFGEEDLQKTGRLDGQTMLKVMQASCQLPVEHSLYLLSNCFELLQPQNGTVDYKTFIKENSRIVAYFMQDAAEFPEVQHEGEEPTVHGLTTDELRSQLVALFQENDEQDTGRLRLQSYFECLCSASIQLTQRDIAMLTLSATMTQDGYVNYAQEAEAAMQLLMLSEQFDAVQFT